MMQRFRQVAVAGRVLDNGARLRVWASYTSCHPGFTIFWAAFGLVGDGARALSAAGRRHRMMPDFGVGG
jgi:hypothetical protein